MMRRCRPSEVIREAGCYFSVWEPAWDPPGLWMEYCNRWNWRICHISMTKAMRITWDFEVSNDWEGKNGNERFTKLSRIFVRRWKRNTSSWEEEIPES